MACYQWKLSTGHILIVDIFFSVFDLIKSIQYNCQLTGQIVWFTDWVNLHLLTKLSQSCRVVYHVKPIVMACTPCYWDSVNFNDVSCYKTKLFKIRENKNPRIARIAQTRELGDRKKKNGYTVTIYIRHFYVSIKFKVTIFVERINSVYKLVYLHMTTK